MNCKGVPFYILGEGSVSELKGILNEQRTAGNGSAVFMIDDFFQDKGIDKSLPLQEGDELVFISTKEEPHTEYIDELVLRLRGRYKQELLAAVIGMGGGTVMDIAKCVSILLTNPGKAEDYQGWDLVKNPAVYKIGIPTLSGTGAESSRTAVITSPRLKLGINSDYSVFDQLILDPTFLKTVPEDQFVYTAMDCYIHDIEFLKGSSQNQMNRAYAEKSLELVREALLEELHYEKLMVASYFGGLFQRNAFLHIIHPLSYGLSLVFGYHHGIANCLVLNQADEYFPQEAEELRAVLKKFNVTLPQGLLRNVTEEQMEKMAEAALKNEKPLRNAFGDNWRDIFTKEKAKEILRKI